MLIKSVPRIAGPVDVYNKEIDAFSDPVWKGCEDIFVIRVVAKSDDSWIQQTFLLNFRIRRRKC